MLFNNIPLGRTRPASLHLPFIFIYQRRVYSERERERKRATDKLLPQSAELNNFPSNRAHPAFPTRARHPVLKGKIPPVNGFPLSRAPRSSDGYARAKNKSPAHRSSIYPPETGLVTDFPRAPVLRNPGGLMRSRDERTLDKATSR